MASSTDQFMNSSDCTKNPSGFPFELPLRVSRDSVVWTAVPPYQSIRTVDIERLLGRSIIVAWRAEPDPGKHTDMGDIFCSISYDDGRKWSSPICIAKSDSKRTWANVILLYEAGRLNAFLGYCPTNVSNSDSQFLAMKVSDDGGLTWQDAPMELAYKHPTICGGKVLRFGDAYLLPFHRNDSVRMHGVLISEDLKHWRLAGVVPETEDTSESDAFLQEGFLAISNDGTGDLLMVMREGESRLREIDGTTFWETFTSHGCVHVTRSKDGHEWSHPEPWHDIPNHNTKGAFLTDKCGRYVAFYNDSADRTRLFTKIGISGRWSAPLMLATGSDWNCYAMAVEGGKAPSGEDRILIAYESAKKRVLFKELLVGGSSMERTLPIASHQAQSV